MLNVAIMVIVIALMLLAYACFVLLRPKTAVFFIVCGVGIFGCGLVLDTPSPPLGMATVVLR
ncbi:hypothetical protein GCM10007874_49880 [Labrys miyagiensis]|uniref:NADH dehydrogenase subunit 6 n=1 Tax=Labrys miyagiensis TaxID=346912 RepID=A0ABQ6CNM2_9HYPH|nr:hypothetical protein GCM10007874_49880 [Labrys miyagiensis]